MEFAGDDTGQHWMRDELVWFEPVHRSRIVSA